MNGERDPETPGPELDERAEQAQQAEHGLPETTADGGAADGDLSDEELDSVSGGMF